MSLDQLRALRHSDSGLMDDRESALFEVARKAREAGRRCCKARPAAQIFGSSH